MAYHWRHWTGARRPDEPAMDLLDPDFDEHYLAAVTAQFAMCDGLTDGERRGYDASWFKVRGDRHDGRVK